MISTGMNLPTTTMENTYRIRGLFSGILKSEEHNNKKDDNTRKDDSSMKDRIVPIISCALAIVTGLAAAILLVFYFVKIQNISFSEHLKVIMPVGLAMLFMTAIVIYLYRAIKKR